jgi:hypothetical protein
MTEKAVRSTAGPEDVRAVRQFGRTGVRLFGSSMVRFGGSLPKSSRFGDDYRSACTAVPSAPLPAVLGSLLAAGCPLRTGKAFGGSIGRLFGSFPESQQVWADSVVR